MTNTGLYTYMNENIMRAAMHRLAYRSFFRQHEYIKPKEFNMELKIND